MAMTREQCRAARALLDWSQEKLAEQSSISMEVLAEFEAGTRIPDGRILAEMQRILEAGGVVFISEELDGVGVRLRRRTVDEGLRPDQLNSENDI
jgi:transcriptional regulator with XRE-family HTH domain